MQKIKVIGVGPGNRSYVTGAALDALKGAGLLIGGRRHLDSFAGDDREKFELANNLEEMTGLIKSRRESGVAILASGDPGMYGILRYLLKHFTPEEIEVVPGVSSVQLAFARLSIPWDDAVILSAHGRPLDNITHLAVSERKVAVLTGSDNPPERIFSVISQGGGRKTCYLCFDLSLPAEAIVRLETGDVYPGEYKGRHNCVMVIVDG